MSFSLAQAVIDAKGTYYAYTDSGEVSGSNDYTTLVIFHGTGANGESFRKLLPLVRGHNLRLLIVNRRDYAGTSPHTDEEVDDAQNGRERYLHVLAADVANLLVWAIENLSLPRMSSDGKTGGLAMMGWSSGMGTVLSPLAWPEALPKGSYEKIEPYLRKVINYDAPYIMFGYDLPDGTYSPFKDPSFKTKDEVIENFGPWCSGYFEHPDVASRKLEGLDTASKRAKTASIFDMSEEEISRMLEPAAGHRAELGTAPYDKITPMLRKQKMRALFDSEQVQKTFPRAGMVNLCCLKSIWFSVWAFFELEREYEEYSAAGKKVRQMKFVGMEGVNHLAHQDHPSKV